MSMDQAKDATEAVLKFSRRLGQRRPARLLVRLDAQAGMRGLCQIEAALSERWPQTSEREFVWLPRSADAIEDRLQLRAFCEKGEVIGDTVFRLDRSHD
jgi:hypothetical protein